MDPRGGKTAIYSLLAIEANILTQFIGQITERLEPQFNELIVKRIELTQGRDAQKGVVKESDVAFKGTASWNQFANKPRNIGGMDLGGF